MIKSELPHINSTALQTAQAMPAFLMDIPLALWTLTMAEKEPLTWDF